MIKILVLMLIAVTVYGLRDGPLPDIPGVSAENMAKLRQLLTPKPANREEFKKIMDQWRTSLTGADRAAAEAHREQMRQKFQREHPEAAAGGQ